MVSDEALRDVLDGWRKSLIGVSRGSSLIKFRTDGRHALSFAEPEPEKLLTALRDGQRFVVRGPKPQPDQSSGNTNGIEAALIDGESGLEDLPQEPGPGALAPGVESPSEVGIREPELPDGCELLRTTTAPDRIFGILRALKKAAEDQYLDRGVNILYLAFGLLHWEDMDGVELCSPLLLVPVKLEARGAFAEPTLAEGDDDDALNPALRLLLEERGAIFDGLPSPEEASVSQVIDGFRAALQRVNELGEWRIEESVHLGKFTFTKEAMYRDLRENEDLVISHPIVRALATTDPTIQTGEFLFEAIDPNEVDRHAPAEDVALVLDADSSQRVAVAASREGKSFVMDGPPGTGKSQTIANMIGALIHDGKSVLFVSEKAAALDVVRNRLQHVGLGSFLFDIHSAKSSRHAVAKELADTLENKPVPPKELDEVSRAALVERRAALSDYAQATNEIRSPLERSFHDVVGRVSQLKDVQLAPAPTCSMDDFSELDLENVLNCARKLARAWRPAVEGSAFIWRGITTDRPLERELSEARRLLERVQVAASPHRELLSRLGLEKLADYENLPQALKHRDSVDDPEILHQWLTAATIDEYRAHLEGMLEEIEARESSAAELHALTGKSHEAFLPSESVPPDPSFTGVHRGQNVVAMDAEALRDAAGLFRKRANLLRNAQQALATVAGSLGLPAPKTYREAFRLHQICALRDKELHPDPRWFMPGEAGRVRQIADELERQHRYVVTVAAAAMQRFTPAALSQPLRDLDQKFQTTYRSFGSRFTAEYKADKRAVESFLKDTATFKDSVGHLGVAIEWADATHYMEHLATSRSGMLGVYWQGPNTDYGQISMVLEAVELALGMVDGDFPAALASYLGGSGDPLRVRALFDEAGRALQGWREVCAAGHDLSPGQKSDDQPIEESVKWLDGASEALTAALARVKWASDVTGKPHTLAEVAAILPALDEAALRARTFDENLDEYRASFGSLMSDPDKLRAGLDHAESIRHLVGGALRAEDAALLLETGTVADLEWSTSQWLRVREQLIGKFEETRREELLQELSTLEDGVEMIEAWREDSTGQQEWADHRTHRDALSSFGLDSAIDFCAQQRIPPEQIDLVVEKVLLESWIENILEDDGRLRPLKSADRDSLVEEFRNLDELQIRHAAGKIIRSANTRRPLNSGIGETGIIRKEGARRRKHIPSRELVAKARGAVQSLKPVFMMSPLAVSQYLPSDFIFDVVIFDEASQVQPAEAINSIYRGRALILAGDDKQLPPTTFFERSVEEEDDADAEEMGIEGVRDYQSVLELAKGSGAFPNLGLRWHYRSRHESLIAFSNYKFYEGKLITFPSALEHGTRVGVTFHQVGGVYQRGGDATNPIEARAVARRVIEHYLQTPDLTLGVVTFSVAQRDAIDDALEVALREHPELEDRFKGEDRLSGYFTRSLESVQGDERDVIFFSVGYGPNEANKISTQFGALNREGGWRRLNVGITRARQSVEVFASMDPGQIPPSPNKNVEYLRAYLQYAQSGIRILALPFSPTGLDPESPFEESVIKAIRDWGYEVEPQVGAAGYRVDLGVRHPEKPGMFILGVECDGFQYHSAPAARDRDRLRDSILIGLGWTMHRIWGTAWYRHRGQEEDRLRAAIESAVRGDHDRRDDRVSISTAPLEVTTEVVDSDELPLWMRPYASTDPISMPWDASPGSPDSLPLVRSALTELVMTEEPVHMNVVKDRLRRWWKIGRVGAQIQANIDRAIDSSEIKRSGDFLYVNALRPDYVRAPSSIAARPATEVHREELALAVAKLVHDAGFAEEGEVILQLRKFFGWRRTGDHILASLEAGIQTAKGHGWIVEQGGNLVPAAEQGRP